MCVHFLVKSHKSRPHCYRVRLSAVAPKSLKISPAVRHFMEGNMRFGLVLDTVVANRDLISGSTLNFEIPQVTNFYFYFFLMKKLPFLYIHIMYRFSVDTSVFLKKN
jgi:hypothetical protein